MPVYSMPNRGKERLIELVHGGDYAFGQDAVNGLGYRGDGWLDCLVFLRGEISEDVVDYNLLVGDCHAVFCGGAADAYLDAAEVIAAQSRDYGLYPLVSSAADAGAEG